MAKIPKNTLSPEDQAAFRDAMQGVKPLVTPTKTKLKPRNQPEIRKRKITLEDEATDNYPFSDYEKLPPVSSEDILEFSRPGVQHKMLRKLRQGQYNVNAILDLHGKTSEEARESLSHFLLACQKKGLRYVMIIHGKSRGSGKPILKNKLNHWLRQTDQVIAFHSATQRDGSSGALYVLLRG